MSIQENAVPAVLSESEKKLKSTALVVYVLYLLSWIIGITGLIGVIIAHIKKSDAAGTAFESHFSNQIKIFWIGLLLAIVGALTTFFVIGWLIQGSRQSGSCTARSRACCGLSTGRPTADRTGTSRRRSSATAYGPDPDPDPRADAACHISQQ